MKRFLLALALCSPFAASAQEPPPQQPAEPDLNWVVGPNTGSLSDKAAITVPAGYRFCGAQDTQKLMKMMQNPVSGQELGFMASDNADWFIVFEFDDIGYVKEDEKDDLDANAILESIKEGNDHANEERRRNGWSTLEITGWHTPPRYDPVTKNLEWAINGRNSDGQNVVNYNTRLLGRSGVMEASLVIDPLQLDATLPEFKQLLTGYAFVQGQTYAEYREGDKIAEYGLTALVTGGAVAVAAKSGLLGKLLKGGWKLLIFVGIAIAGLFKKITGSKE